MREKSPLARRSPAARASEGVFLASNGSLKTIALSGHRRARHPVRAPFVEVRLARAQQSRTTLCFLATVRRGRETLPVLYLWSPRSSLRKLVGRRRSSCRAAARSRSSACPRDQQQRRCRLSRNRPIGAARFWAACSSPAPVSPRLLVGAGENGTNGRPCASRAFPSDIAPERRRTMSHFGAHLGTGHAPQEGGLRCRIPFPGIKQVAIVGDEAPGGGTLRQFRHRGPTISTKMAPSPS